MQAIGIVVLFAAIMLVQFQKGRWRVDVGVVWVIVSAALFAGMQVASADLSKFISTGTYLVFAYGGPTLVVGCLYARSIRQELPGLFRNPGNTLVAILFAAITSLTYSIFSYFAYHSASDAGIVVALLTTQVVLSVILGIIFMRERNNVPHKLLAGLLAFVAGALIKAG
jgi:drug/metabolite transporter (DMT)-like permease